MEFLFALAFIVVGLAILITGADTLVKGAASLSKRAGVAPIVVGLTVVAFWTSAPELVVSLTAALGGNTDIAIGNVVGSNTANILLILWACALIANLKVQKATTWKEIPFSILAAIMLFVMGNDVLFADGEKNVLGMGDGLVFLGFFAIFMYYVHGLAAGKSGEIPEEVAQAPEYGYAKSAAFTAIGLVGLVTGGKLFIEGAVDLARIAGLSEILIGLTIVAIGTSLPELVTSIVATKNGHADIAIGNVVGSSVFNIFWILGITAIIAPVPLSAAANFDIVMMLGSSFILFVALSFANRHQLTRKHGILMLSTYAAYTAFLVVRW